MPKTLVLAKPAALALCLLLVGGCVVNATIARHTTFGQELIDLQKAHAIGAISDADYEKKKQQILNESTSFSNSRSTSSTSCSSSTVASPAR